MKPLIALFLLLSCGAPNPSSLKTDAPRRVLGDVDIAKNRNAGKGLPYSEKDTILISRDEYVLSYNQKTRLANWVAWQVRPEDLGSSGRSEAFDVDPDLRRESLNPVEAHEYKGSCLDRGHQTPSADRTKNIEINRKTFYMSNMIPQTAYLNRVLWEHLEHHTREIVRSGRTVYVFAGPIVTQRRVGINRDIGFPEKNFKILLADDGGVISAVVMPNITSAGTDPLTDKDQACADLKDPKAVGKDWSDYEVPVETVEEESGIKFLK